MDENEYVFTTDDSTEQYGLVAIANAIAYGNVYFVGNVVSMVNVWVEVFPSSKQSITLQIRIYVYYVLI